MEPLSVQAIGTRVFRAEEDLAQFIVDSIPRSLIQERLVLAVTSKIMSLAENCIVPRSKMSKANLVQREAEEVLGEVLPGCYLTIKHGLFIPSAGIDESNSETGDFILFPSDPYMSTHALWLKLRKAWNIEELGIVLTDSHTTPLRKGVTGICLAHWGFRGVRELVGEKDLFGRSLQMTSMALADGLAATAVMMMGESAEAQPLALIRGAPIEFVNVNDSTELRMPLREDLYSPFFR